MNYEERYVAFIDILGFKSIINESSEKSEELEYIQKILNILKNASKNNKFITTQFSDSLVISVKADSNELEELIDVLLALSIQGFKIWYMLRAGSLVTVLGKLISALENPDCPAHYKALIIGAIGYIVLPFDIVPDALPGVGWVDDLTVAGGVVATVAIYSDFSLEKLDAYIDQMEG